MKIICNVNVSMVMVSIEMNLITILRRERGRRRITSVVGENRTILLQPFVLEKVLRCSNNPIYQGSFSVNALRCHNWYFIIFFFFLLFMVERSKRFLSFFFVIFAGNFFSLIFFLSFLRWEKSFFLIPSEAK